MGIGAFDQVTPHNEGVNIFDFLTTTDVLLYGSGSLNLYLTEILASNSDTIDHRIRLFFTPNIGGNCYIGDVLLPARCGYDLAPPILVLHALGLDALPFAFSAQDFLRVSTLVTMNTGTEIDLYCIGGVL